MQSNLGAARGLLGASGATGAASAVDIGGELVVLLEELPRLKESLAGLPGTVKAAAASLGTGGLALTGVIVAAGAAAVIASRQLQGVKQALENALAANATFVGQLQDFTTEEAEAELEDLQRRIPILAEEAEIANQRYQAARDQFEAIVSQFIIDFARLTTAVGTLGISEVTRQLPGIGRFQRDVEQQIGDAITQAGDRDWETMASNWSRAA